jgi:ABC-type transporter Mla subunit MlaD
MELYLVLLLGYLLVYVVAFIVPLIAASGVAGMRGDLARLVERMSENRVAAKQASAERARPRAVLVEAASGMEAEELMVEEEGDVGGDGEVAPESQAELIEEQQRQRARRTERPEALEAEYANALVKDTAAYFRARYPTGDFRTFAMERLPSYARYAERVLAARNMAGLFVLVGLFGTMLKLNAVVGDIGALSDSAQMTQEDFLGSMGLIMANTGGAFWSSIYGLGLMVLALLVIGIWDRFVQTATYRLDRDVQQQLVPDLVGYHEAVNPNLSVSDLIAETGSILGGLNRTVAGLTHSIDGSLSGLGDRIEQMLQEFGSFTQQYTKLSDLLSKLKEASKEMTGVTKAVERAARGIERTGEAIGQPIADFNRSINDTLRETLSTVVDAMERQRVSHEGLAEQVHQMQAGVQDTTRTLQEQLEAYLGESGEHHRTLSERLNDRLQQLGETSDGHHRRMIEQLQMHLTTFEEQSTRVQQELGEVAQALRAANTQEVARTIEQLNGKVTGSANVLRASADGLRTSADQLIRAAEAFQTQGDNGTLFGWARQKTRRFTKRSKR